MPRARESGPRERWITIGSTMLIAALVIAVGISFTSVRRQSRHGCVDVNAATVIGGSELYRCGATARELCAGTRAPKQSVAFTHALDSACRKAGLPSAARA